MKKIFLLSSLAVGGLLIILSFFVFKYGVSHVKTYDTAPSKIITGEPFNDSKITHNGNEYVYNLDNVTIDNTKMIDITGWIIKQNSVIKRVSIKTVLKDMTTNQYYELPTVVHPRTDINTVFNDKINYTYSGFSTYLPVPAALRKKKITCSVYILFSLNGKPRLIKTTNQLVLVPGEKK